MIIQQETATKTFTRTTNFDATIGDSTFKLLQDIHDGNEPHEKLGPKLLNSKSATLYLARELNFLQEVAAASGHEMTSQLLQSLHIELLKKSIGTTTTARA